MGVTPPDVADLKLHLFGAPRMEADGEPVSFDTRKAFALLAYLALHEPQHRDILGTLLWPDQDATHARGALRRTLSAVKKPLADDALVATRDLVGLVPGSIWVDVVEFRSAVEQGDCERAAALHIDEFLSGFALNGAPAFDDWIVVERESLRRAAARCLATLGRAALADGDHEKALAHLRRWLSLDPLDESAHRSLIEAYVATGDRAAALRQYDACVRVLEEELAVAPLEETTALYESIKGGTVSVPRSRTRSIAVSIPFVGRSAEVQRILDAIGEAAIRTIVVEGEAGIGKSAVLDEVVRRTEAVCHEVRCHEEEKDQAFGVAARILRGLIEESSTRSVRALEDGPTVQAARLVPEIRTLRPDLPEAGALSDPGARTAFFEGVWQVLLALTGNEPTLLIVDDAHWLDEGSFELIAFGLRRADLGAFQIALAWRSEEVTRNHALRRLVDDLTRTTGALGLSLSRLQRSDVEVLVDAAAPNEGDVLAAALFEESEGVPFFIVEYLRAHLAGEPPTGGVEGFVRSQVARLTPLAGQVLSAGSVLGRSTDLDLLREVAGRNEDEIADAVEELTDRHLLVERTEGYDFAHEKVRQVVYSDISLARRRLLHGRAHAHLLRVVAQRPETRALAAYHARQAGRRAEAADQYFQAGLHALTVGANVDALGQLETALELGPSDIAETLVAIGDAQTLLGRYGDALSSYREALAQSTQGWKVEHKLGRLYLRRGEAAPAMEHLRAALGAVPADQLAQRARIAADLALALRSVNEPDEARTAASAALEDAVQADDAAAVAQARNILGLLEPDPDLALAHLRQSEEAARSVADTGTRIAALNNISLAHRRRQDVPEAIQVAEQALELCSRRGDIHREAALHNNLADAFHELGQEERSREHARAAAGLFAQVGEPGVMSPEIWKLVEW